MQDGAMGAVLSLAASDQHPFVGRLRQLIALAGADLRAPIERLSHFLLELHARLTAVRLVADVLGLGVPHLNRTRQRLPAEKLIAD
jgi:hypothetical protein